MCPTLLHHSSYLNACVFSLEVPNDNRELRGFTLVNQNDAGVFTIDGSLSLLDLQSGYVVITYH